MGGYVRYTIKNLNREKLLREMVKIAIVKNIKLYEDKLSFVVKENCIKKIDAVLQKRGSKVISKTAVGLLNYIHTSIFRIGVIIPSVLFILAVIICNGYIFNIKVLGTEMVDKNDVIKIINNCGVYSICNKNQIDTTTIENDILKIDKVSLVSAIVKGNTLVVNIKEKLYNPEFEDKDGFLPILSLYDGIITEINIIQGTSLVKVGQTVKKGQEIVAPYVMDASGDVLSVLPMADIKADVFYTITQEVPDKKIEQIDTGNVIRSKKIMLNNMVIYNQNITVSFPSYRASEEISVLTDRNFLPIKYVNYVYYETKFIEIDDYFINNKTQILEQLAQKTRQLVDEYDIIKEEYVNVFSVAGINRITHTIIVNKSIC